MKTNQKAFTLLELLVVVMIISLLSTMLVGVYTKEVEKARIATAASDCREMDMAAQRFKMDIGRFPYALNAVGTAGSVDVGTFNNGYFHAEVVYGKDGGVTPTAPGELTPVEKKRWNGPYLNVQKAKIYQPEVAPGYADVVIIDPWGSPYSYTVTNLEPIDATSNATVVQSGPFKDSRFNEGGVQIFSKGPDGVTPAPKAAGLGADDITNFSM